jgi:hypothetical protein
MLTAVLTKRRPVRLLPRNGVYIRRKTFHLERVTALTINLDQKMRYLMAGSGVVHGSAGVVAYQRDAPLPGKVIVATWRPQADKCSVGVVADVVLHLQIVPYVTENDGRAIV